MIEEGGGCIEGVRIYASTESAWSSSNFGRARRMFIRNAAVSANMPIQRQRTAVVFVRGTSYRLWGHAR